MEEYQEGQVWDAFKQAWVWPGTPQQEVEQEPQEKQPENFQQVKVEGVFEGIGNAEADRLTRPAITNKVIGQRQLDDDDIVTINLLKMTEERMYRSMRSLRQVKEYDQRLVSLALTHLEMGFMFAMRAVSRPERLVLPEDTEGAPAVSEEETDADY